MKKRICLVLVIVLVLGCITVHADSDVPLFKFTCMSDVHIDDVFVQSKTKNRTQFKTALNYAAGMNYTDLFVSGGDVSSYGSTKVWDEAKSSIEDAGFNDILWALGNHEYGTINENSNADKDFKSFAGKSSIYYHEVINDCHFIVMGVEQCDIFVLDGRSVYSTTQEDWVRAELDAAAKESYGKPIFIISHYPLNRTNLADDLAKYDNVFFFWGHSHDADWEDYPIEKYINTNNRYTTSRMGATQYGSADIADVLLVDVYEDRVVLTIARTQGRTMDPDSVTVPLTLPSGTVFFKGDALYWYPPKRDDVYLCFAAYDNDGRLLHAAMLRYDSASYRQMADIDSVRTDGYSKAFFLDPEYIPIMPTIEFDFAAIIK